MNNTACHESKSQDGKSTARTPSLRIPAVERFDAGLYQCEASNGVGSPASASLNLQVGWMDSCYYPGQLFLAILALNTK